MCADYNKVATLHEYFMTIRALEKDSNLSHIGKRKHKLLLATQTQPRKKSVNSSVYSPWYRAPLQNPIHFLISGANPKTKIEKENPFSLTTPLATMLTLACLNNLTHDQLCLGRVYGGSYRIKEWVFLLMLFA